MIFAVALALRIAVGICLIAASLAKAQHFRSFVSTLEALGTPNGLAAPMGRLFIVVETTVGLYLVSTINSPAADVAALAFLLALCAVSLYALAVRRDIACTCFGPSAKRLGRDTLLLACVLAAAEFAYVSYEWLRDGSAVEGNELLGVVALALCLILAYRWVEVARTLIAIIGQRRQMWGLGV